MKYLLNVNILIALGFLGHEFHGTVTHWVGTLSTTRSVLATCSLTELGFVRILAQTPQYAFTIDDTKNLLRELKAASPVRFEFFVDNHDASHLPPWVRAPKQISDGHLLQLAKANGAELVTLDRGIPGAMLIPL